MKHFPGERLIIFLRLIRLPNLLIVALTMILMRYAIIRPLLESMPVAMLDAPLIVTRMTFQLQWYDFLILILSTLFITAGGYVINDYFDIRADLINRGTVIVGNTITRRAAMMYHNIFNILGVAGGFYVSARAGYFWMGVLFLLVSGLLYFYSSSYKRQFLIGNIIVAFLTAMVPFMVVLYDAPSIYRHYAASTVSFPGVILLFYWVGSFAVFAFMTTLIREIIKDMEDTEGDLALGRKTLPAVAGILATRIIVVALCVLTLLMIYLLWYFYLNDLFTLGYATLLIAVPLIPVIFKVITSNERAELHRASRMMKFIMLAGILYSLVAGAIITSGKVI